MAAGNFSACIEQVKPFEGGYVNDAADPGGETNYGISKRAYPGEDIKRLTWTRARQLYQRDYWGPIQGERLPVGVDLVVLDPAINSGIRQAGKWLQRAVGLTGKAVDGAIGNVTLGATHASDARRVLKSITDQRLSMLRGLKTWARFGKGWTRRVTTMEAAGLKMMGADLSREAARAEGEAKQHNGASAATAGGAGATGIGIEGLDMPTVLVAVVVIVGVLIALKLARDARIDKARAKAMREAEKE